MRPSVGVSSPATKFSSVDLPAPLGPINPTIAPAGTRNEAPLTAWTPPNSLVSPVTSRSHSFGWPEADLSESVSSEKETPSAIRGLCDPTGLLGQQTLGPIPDEHQHQDSDQDP